jgi:hypothetical protein
MAYANPIPVPSVPLTNEDISISVKLVDGVPFAKVFGEYSFGRPVGYEGSVTLKFPVPKGSRNIEVMVDGRPVGWKFNGTYMTKPIEIEMDVIQWNVDVVNEMLPNVTVEYEHPLIDLGNGTYLLVYSLGSSKLNAQYAKGCQFEIRISLPEKGFEVFRGEVDQETGAKKYEWVYVNEDEATYRGTLTLMNMFDDFFLKMSTSWVKSMPLSAKMDVKVEGDRAMITVSLILPHPAFKVFNVSYDKEGYSINGYLKLLGYTGPVAQVITMRNVTYTVKGLEAGDYMFNLVINEKPYASTTFSIPSGRTFNLWVIPLLLLAFVIAFMFRKRFGFTS